MVTIILWTLSALVGLVVAWKVMGLILDIVGDIATVIFSILVVATIILIIL